MKGTIRQVTAILILVVSVNCTKAQSTAGAYATASIVTPVTVIGNGDIGFETLLKKPLPVHQLFLKGGGNGYNSINMTTPYTLHTFTALDFTINGAEETAFTVMVPQTVMLIHTGGAEKMTMDLVTGYFSKTGILNGGKQTLKAEAILYIDKDQMQGKYHSTDYELIVNFN